MDSKILEHSRNCEMLRNMKRLLTLLWMVSSAGLAAHGQAVQPYAKSVAPPVLTPQDSTPATRFSENLIELQTKSALLLALAEEHLKKSEQALSVDQPEKARWEQELANDLQGRNSIVSNRLSELKLALTKPEEAQAGAAAKFEGLESDELVYLAKLNERLATTDREIGAAMEEAQSYVLQLQTNNTPDQMQSVSGALEDNRRTMKELRKQRSDLELKKLEFWAYRRRR
jgi:hypothetical protein